ncbi:MAG TPA: ATP-dependent DNA helicase RecG [Patescibacteria group bacterium]|jgi:ATP-dependent DNA helicase RecG|nr:ATP-dependent DNA helicase RecG [Patescibacteria group bacterium]
MADIDIKNLLGVGSAFTKAFATLKISTVADLLYNFPTRYMDYRKKVNIGQAIEGDVVTIVGRVKNIKSNFGFRGRVSYAEATLEDGTGTIKAIWFNQTWIAKQIKVGDELILSGQVGRYKTLQLSNPAYELLNKIDDEDTEAGVSGGLHTGRLVPIYKRSDLVPLRTLRKLVKESLPAAAELEDYIPKPIAKKAKLVPLPEAITHLHFPETDEQIDAARFRIAVDDILPQQLAVLLNKDIKDKEVGIAVKPNIEQVKTFLSTLPFTLTPSQKRAAWDIFQDMETGAPMNRLLQGDVGSGKTIVAILAALQTAGSGFQTALLAPTEILAKQHYDTFRSVLGSGEGIALLTRTFANTNGQEITRAELATQIKSGEIKICIGTHALLQGKTEFHKLGLVIIDEQHRFGVSQRSFLFHDSSSQKSGHKTSRPHLLSMSATPIPRTLAMSLYADLSVSTLSHVPTGRKPVRTSVVPESKRDQAYEFVKKEIAAGHQAFVVTPRVEDTESSEVRSVKKEFTRLQKDVFPKLRLGLLYGKMKGADKEKVMAEFASGKIDILVATSVIEIGIDIPNATAMIIEGSERFGLAQLHQLRGRIGRNNFDCECFLFTTQDSQQDTKRLNALAKINDGFELAKLDLEERGFGDLFGKEQSGFMFRFPKFITVKALLAARDIAAEIHQTDPKLMKSPGLQAAATQYLADIHAE